MAINLDENLDNADWTKRGSWDLIGIDSVEKLRDYLKRTGSSVEAFKRLPVYRWHVDDPEMGWLKEL